MEGCSRNMVFDDFSKVCCENSSFIQIWQDVCDNISLNLATMKNVADKRCRENQNTHFVFNKFLFSESRVFYEIMCKNMVQPDGSQVTIQYGECALLLGYLRQEYTRRITNTNCFSQTRFSVISYVQCLCGKVLNGDNKINNPSPPRSLQCRIPAIPKHWTSNSSATY
jgi:hypothetical protein